MVNSIYAMIAENQIPLVIEKDINMAQAQGAHTVLTASEDLAVEWVLPFATVLVTGLTTFHIDTDNTTADAILGSTAAATASAGKLLTPKTTPFFIPKGKHITMTVVGADGTAGNVRLCIKYWPVGPGARLS